MAKLFSMSEKITRRKVLRLAAGLPLLSLRRPYSMWRSGEKNLLRLGIIGFGIRGEQLLRALGFATPTWEEKNKGNTAHSMYVKTGKLNVNINGVCDLYDARAERALQAAGKQAKRYKRYHDMLADKSIDAVIIATPDHMHARIVIDAANAGKHVYVEKCLTRTLDEVYDVRDAVQKSKVVFQLGHQLRQKDTVAQARDIMGLDILGKLSLVETSSNRNSPNAAWVYDIPHDASEKTIDWKQFDPDRPFDADRFFRWRKYWDYGTGLSGDLLTHEFDTVNCILQCGIPDSAIATGGLYYFKDGREVPDVLQAAFEFSSRAFTMTYSATLVNDHHRPALYMGRDATLKLDNEIHVYPNANSTKYKQKFESGDMKPGVSFYDYPAKGQAAVEIDAISGATTKYFAEKGMMSTVVDGKPVDPTRIHLLEWLLCIENGWIPSCNIDEAFSEAITAHMATISYKTGRQVRWDKTTERLAPS